MTPVELVLSRLPDSTKCGNGWKARCPAHDDRNPSLSVWEYDDGSAGVNCYAGCEREAVLSRMGLISKDLKAVTSRHIPTNGRTNSAGRPQTARKRAERTYPTADAAVEAVARSNRFGKPDCVWPYHDVNGTEVARVLRWNMPDGKKEIRPIHRDGTVWRIGSMSVPRQIYRLPEVLTATQVFVCEGEKAADALRSVGLTATTSPHGASSADKTDWSPLAGKELVIVPDNDEPGRKYADAVYGCLSVLQPTPIVKLMELDGLPDKGDAFDWVEQRDATDPESLRQQLEALADAAPLFAAPDVNGVATDMNAAMAPQAKPLPRIISVGTLVERHPQLRPEIVDGLIRQGEICNIIAKSKVGKSWLGYGLALSVATGRNWLGRFRCTPGKVLLIDNELHPELLASRIPTVASAMGLLPEEYSDRIDVLSLRGHVTPLDGLRNVILDIEPGRYSLVILDAMYRVLPVGVSENDNATMTAIYNTVDGFADATGAAFVLIHHASKGDQSGKDVTDIGSGAGAQSRAADTHLVIRPHADDGAAVLEAAVRSFPPVERLGIRWGHPLWLSDNGLDTKRLKRSTTAHELQQVDRDRKGCEAIVAALRASEPMTIRRLRNTTSYGVERLNRLVKLMESDGRLVGSETVVNGNPTTEYRLANHLQGN